MVKVTNLIATGAVAVLGVAGAIGVSAQAEPNCVVTNGAISMSDQTMCVITENVDTINYNGTIEDLHVVLHALANNTGFGYTQYAASSTIEATITNMFSTEGVDVVTSAAPAGAIINITPGVADIVYTQAPWTPAVNGVSINYANTIIHLQDGVAPSVGVDVYSSIGDDSVIVAEGSNYTISTEMFQGKQTIVLHLPEGTSEEDALAIAKTITNANLMVGVNNNTDFTVTVQAGQEPVINHYEDIIDDDGEPAELTAPETGRR